MHAKLSVLCAGHPAGVTGIRIRETKAAVGRRLLDVPGFVCNRSLPQSAFLAVTPDAGTLRVAVFLCGTMLGVMGATWWSTLCRLGWLAQTQAAGGATLNSRLKLKVQSPRKPPICLEFVSILTRRLNFIYATLGHEDVANYRLTFAGQRKVFVRQLHYKGQLHSLHDGFNPSQGVTENQNFVGSKNQSQFLLFIFRGQFSKHELREREQQ
jgi:hypothetical protein